MAGTFLLDTHVLLWLAADARQLPERTRGLADDPQAELLFSVASLWEIVIKNSLARPDFMIDAAALRQQAIAAGLGEIPVRGHHVLEVGRLPGLHADPFDRVLLAQARSEGVRLLTADRKVLEYGVPAEPA